MHRLTGKDMLSCVIQIAGPGSKLVRGEVEIVPIGLNFRPASEAAKRGCAEF